MLGITDIATKAIMAEQQRATTLMALHYFDRVATIGTSPRSLAEVDSGCQFAF
jgi:hypothetical protein